MAKEALLIGAFEDKGISEEVGFVGRSNVLISGGLGSVILEKSFDKETYYPVTDSPIRVSENTPLNGVVEEHENNVYYRFRCIEYIAGEIQFRLGKPTVIR